jgi:rRNA maturation endonuclease Nob1
VHSLDQGNLIATLGLVAAVMMIRIGVIKKMFEFRHPPHHCAACGRSYSSRTCPSCGARA